jgi:hypothetical protein
VPGLPPTGIGSHNAPTGPWEAKILGRASPYRNPRATAATWDAGAGERREMREPEPFHFSALGGVPPGRGMGPNRPGGSLAATNARSRQRDASLHPPRCRHFIETTARPFSPHPRHRTRSLRSSTLVWGRRPSRRRNSGVSSAMMTCRPIGLPEVALPEILDPRGVEGEHWRPMFLMRPRKRMGGTKSRADRVSTSVSLLR